MMIKLTAETEPLSCKQWSSVRNFCFVLLFSLLAIGPILLAVHTKTAPQKKQFRILEAVTVKAEMQDGGQVELDLPVGCLIVVQAHKSKEEFAMGRGYK